MERRAYQPENCGRLCSYGSQWHHGDTGDDEKISWSHINQNSDEDGPVSKTVAGPRSSLEIRSKNILMQQNLTMSTEACHCGELCSISYVRIDGTAEAQLPCGHRFYRACMTKWLIRGSLQCPMRNREIGENCSN